MSRDAVVTDPYFLTAVPPAAAGSRHAMIREAAYYLAEHRGFAPGLELEDWLRAEKQIDAALGSRPAS